MTQYYEIQARQIESCAGTVSGLGEHGLANQLWALAARVGTRVIEEPVEPGTIVEDGDGHKWITNGERDWKCLDHDLGQDFMWSWDIVVVDCHPPLRIIEVPSEN